MNRLDGKPAEEMNINTNTKRDATDWTRAELGEVITNARTRGNRADQAVRRHRELMEFTRYTFRKYQVNSHHKTIASQLERVERGEIDRLMCRIRYLISRTVSDDDAHCGT
jgi:hypothetical protein